MAHRYKTPQRPYPAAGWIVAVLIVLTLALGACAPTLMPPGPPTVEPEANGKGFVMSDGAVLPMRVWGEDIDKPKAVIVALHGMNDYSNFFDAPGRYFAEHGVKSYAYDQRGFGDAPNRGYWPGYRAFTRDLRDVVQIVKSRYPETPVYVLGTSMGGAVALVSRTSKNRPGVDGVILVAPAIWGREHMNWFETTLLFMAGHVFPWAEFSGRGLGVVPSDNREMLIALGKDPKVIKSTRADAIYGLVNLMDAAYEGIPRLEGHALIIHGRKDELIRPKLARVMLDRLPDAQKDRYRIALYPDGYHMLLRDLQAEVVYKDILAWIDDKSAPLPSGHGVSPKDMDTDAPKESVATRKP